MRISDLSDFYLFFNTKLLYNQIGVINMNNKLALAATKAGVILLESGAETYRVEDTMKRICFAYGAKTCDSYATPTMLLISFSVDGELYHNMKRTSIKSVDLNKIDRVNALSRKIEKEVMPLEEFMKELEIIDNHEIVCSEWMKVFAAAIAVFGFVWFYGGTMKDASCGFLLGGILKKIMNQIDKVDFTAFFKNVFGGAMVTLASISCVHFGLCDSLDILIISVIMLLVPGLAFTNAIRDSVNGDLVSGLARTTEAIFVAVAIAIGSGMVFFMFGGY